MRMMTCQVLVFKHPGCYNFSDVLRGDWPRGVDARPPAWPEEDATSALLESGDGRIENSPPVSKKF